MGLEMHLSGKEGEWISLIPASLARHQNNETSAPCLHKDPLKKHMPVLALIRLIALNTCILAFTLHLLGHRRGVLSAHLCWNPAKSSPMQSPLGLPLHCQSDGLGCEHLVPVSTSAPSHSMSSFSSSPLSPCYWPVTVTTHINYSLSFPGSQFSPCSVLSAGKNLRRHDWNLHGAFVDTFWNSIALCLRIAVRDLRLDT